MNEISHPAPRTAHDPGRLATWISDRANPMLVRCVRQELRSKTFIGVFVLLLVVATIAAISIAALATDVNQNNSGRQLFNVLSWAWSFVVVVQTMTTFRAVTQERNDDTWDLVDLTGIGPRRILRGLLIANLVQGLLYAAALAPFLVMAYLLRGLDLLTIVFALVVVPAGGVASSTLAVFCASLGNNKASRAFLGGMLGLGMVGIWLASIEVWFSSYTLDSLLSELRNGGMERLIPLGLMVNLWLAFIVAMLVLSGALMTHRAADRSGGPRLLWFVLWLDGLLWFSGIGWWSGQKFHTAFFTESLASFSLTGVVWSCILGLFSISEDYALSARQARAITAARGWRRWASLLLGPGASRGRFAFLALGLASVGVAAVATSLADAPNWVAHCLLASALLMAYALIIFVSGDWLYRGPCRQWIDSPVLRRGFLLVLVAVWCLAPLLAGLVISARDFDQSALVMFSPVMGVTRAFDGFDDGTGGVVTWPLGVLGGGAIALGLLVVQALRLGITTQRIAARADDVNPRGG